MPLRVIKVPRMVRAKVAWMSTWFQRFKRPRFSCMMMEWRKAVAVNQGRKEAFSTGSQPQ